MTSPYTLMKGTAISFIVSIVLAVIITLLSDDLLFDPARLKHLLALLSAEFWLKTTGVAVLGSATALLFGGKAKPVTAGVAIACCLVPIGATLFTLGTACFGATIVGGVSTLSYGLLAITMLSAIVFVSVALVFAYRNSLAVTGQLSAALARIRSHR